MATAITRLAVEDIESWPLRNPADLFEALTELQEKGWDGAIEHELSTWRLRLSRSGKNTVNAAIGQWLVLDGELKTVSPADFDSQYASPEPVEFPAAEVTDDPEPEAEPEQESSPDTAVPISRTVR